MNSPAADGGVSGALNNVRKSCNYLTCNIPNVHYNKKQRLKWILRLRKNNFRAFLKRNSSSNLLSFFNMDTQQHQSPSTKRFKQHPAVVFSELDDQITLFQSKTCDYLVLNETGSAIWQALQATQTLNQICDLLCAEFNVERSICIQETTNWLEQAINKNIIVIVAE